MTRPEESPWAVPVATVASRAGRSQRIDHDFPAPDGIGDEVIGIAEGATLHVSGTIDSIVDGLVLTASVVAPTTAECTRCLRQLDGDRTFPMTVFFPYDAVGDGGHDDGDERDIVAGEDEAEDVYPLLAGGAWLDLEAPLRDTLTEALPLQPLCKPDCRGLCPQCGIDLNEHPDHRHDVTDIRFAALAEFRDRLAQEGAERDDRA